MDLPSLLFRRSLARWRFLVPLALVLAALTALPLLLTAAVDTVSAAGSTAFVHDQPARAASVRVEEDLDTAATEQAHAVAAAITEHFPRHSVDVVRGTHSTADLVDGRAVEIAAIPDLARVARLRAGEWVGEGSPGAIAGVLQVDAARRLGVTVGSTIAVGDPDEPIDVLIVGTWRADDPGAARWFGASDVGSGRDGDAVGPLVVAADDLVAVTGTARATWTITPSAGLLTPADVQDVRRGIAAVTTAASGGSSVLAGADVSGTLDATLAEVQASVRTETALVTVAMAVIAVVGTLTVILLVTLVARSREAEDRLLTARGASVGQRLRWAVLEGLGVGLLGAAAGTVLVVAAVLLGVGGSSVSGAVVDPARVLLVVLLVVLVAVLSNGGAALRLGQRDGAGRAGWWTAAPAVLFTAAAGFTVWRLGSASAPGRVTGDGFVLDPVASAAPVVVVLAGSAVSALAVLVASRVAARGVRRTRRLLPALTVRRLARGWSTVAPVVVIVVIAVSTGGFAAGFAATSARVERVTAMAVVGPEVRVVSDGDAVVSDDTPDQGIDRPLDGATAIGPVLTDTVRTGGSEIPFTALPRSVMPLAVPSLDARNAAALHHDVAGVPLPAGTTRVRVVVRSAVPTLNGVERVDARGSLRYSLWVGDSSGVVRSFTLAGADGEQMPTGTSTTLTATLPADHRWRVLAVAPTLTFSVRPAEVDATVSPATRPARLRVALHARVLGVDDAVGTADVEDLTAAPIVRLGAPAIAGRLPVVVTAATAASLGARVGTNLDLTLASTSAAVRARIAAVVPRVSGTSSQSGIVADLRTLTDASVLGGGAIQGAPGTVPRVDETWIASSDLPATTASVLRALPVPGSVVTTASAYPGRIVDVARAVLVGVAVFAALSAALVIAAVSVVTGRSSPTVVLRSLGVAPGAAARARATEVGGPVVVALALGFVSAVVVVALTAAPFAHGSVPTSLGLVDVGPTAAVRDVLLVPAAIAVVTAVAAIVAARSVARRMDRTTAGEADG
ncbi:FtsX-like permease family protein [Curtobacterium sp. MCPF17_047]|uniref:FtsX-like permease family protein n=1 Tax=Curtobacterium sp. MCPF17_047 TaxID=2175654 RepID=UPI0011B3B0FA|nr:FtsX-like permease family protein [Curtobacterium sp. MCPF17_047]